MKNPLRRKNKKKAMKATWDDDSESEFDDEAQEEIANICFMAIDNEVKSLELTMMIFLMMKLVRKLLMMNYLIISMICT